MSKLILWEILNCPTSDRSEKNWAEKWLWVSLLSNLRFSIPASDCTSRIGDHPTISPSRCVSEGPAGRQCLPAQCPCHYGVPLRGMFLCFFFFFLNKPERAFYPIFILKMSSHLAFFKIICLYFIIILCTFEIFTWSGILCDFRTMCYQKEPSTLGVNKIEYIY